MSKGKKFLEDAAHYLQIVNILYTSGKIAEDVYNRIRGQIQRLEELGEEIEEGGNVAVELEEITEATELVAEISAEVAAASA